MIPIYSPILGSIETENVIKTITTGWISSQGQFIPQFEEQFAQWNFMKYGIATSNCTAALHLALVALGIGKGDEVLCPDLTFIAPANMIKWAGASPVLVDIEEPSWGIDSKKMEERITKKTKAIIVVHPFGHVANMDPILQISEKYNLFVIEDVAEAPGAAYKGKRAGSFGDASCFSFFANKIMTTGEGGIVLTNNHALNKQLQIYRDHGMSRERRYVHVVPGFNYRMTNMQAAIGVGQIQKLDKIIRSRADQERRYKDLFLDNPRIKWRPVAKWCDNVHWMATITLREERLRDLLLVYMRTQGVDCRQMVYPIHMAKPYSSRNSPSDYPISNSISLRSLHLPSSFNLSIEEQRRITDLVQEWLERNDP